ncbi:Aste57867_14135 [Aphanomyces stellatus]|uniref:Aste57867_14135 protein n=1 Tax=Aphanomyces stellatus TaxID=120398 RepID=A0A485KZW0_9STRA|nr:hypothetical protein As57867_014084 [Aphanomyces stellatus]VFT90961.1 Aste57867_14135 [Aphanomyces stellatus]
MSMVHKAHLSFILHGNATTELPMTDAPSPQQQPRSPQKSSQLKLMYNRARQRKLRQQDKMERQQLRRQVRDLEMQLRKLQATKHEKPPGARLLSWGMHSAKGVKSEENRRASEASVAPSANEG